LSRISLPTTFYRLDMRNILNSLQWARLDQEITIMIIESYIKQRGVCHLDEVGL
jgi:hypothetical protein